MKLFYLLSLVLLASCSTTPKLEKPETKIVDRVEYVIKLPPPELMELPPPVEPINVDIAKQSDIARWILSSEERTRKLENMLIQLALFFKIEQNKLQGTAAVVNADNVAKPPSRSASQTTSENQVR